MYGIASGVEDRVSAYRGRPDMLTQRYQQGRDLMDLLALQKLKSEKEEAKRQLALQAQTPPATIADQREQQVLGLVKESMAQDPANSGIAAHMRTPMQFASGGITGYAEGGPLEEEEEVGIPGGAALRELGGGVASGLKALMRILGGGNLGSAVAAEMGQSREGEATPRRRAPVPELGPPAPAAPPAAAPAAPADDAQALAEFNAMIDAAAPTAAAAPQSFVPQAAQDYITGALTADPVDPYAGVGKFKEALGLGQLMEERKAEQEARRAAYEAENSPERRRREAIRAFLQAGAGGTSTASALGLGSRGMSRAEEQQRARDEAFRAANIADVEGRIAEAIGIGTAGVNVGLEEARVQQAKTNTAVQGALEMARQQLTASEGVANRNLERVLNDQRTAAAIQQVLLKGAGGAPAEAQTKLVNDIIMKVIEDPSLQRASPQELQQALIERVAAGVATLQTYGGMADAFSDATVELDQP